MSDTPKTDHALRFYEAHELPEQMREIERARDRLAADNARLAGEGVRLRNALQWLVDLKDIKDRYGKSAEYVTQQSLAWKAARAALAAPKPEAKL